MAISALVVAFFWTYDAVAHREPPAIPEFTAPAAQRANYQPAPAPDMGSEAVTLANADASPQHARPMLEEEPKAAAVVPQTKSAAAPRPRKPAVVQVGSEVAQSVALANSGPAIRTHGF